MQNFLLFFAILARVQDQEKRANRLSISEMSKRLPGNSLTLSVINHLNHPQATFPSSNPTILQVTSEVTAMSKKYSIVERLVQSGRENDTLECFKQAIALGSFPARADLALLCFNRNLTYPECREAFFLVKDGHNFGCSDCTGMVSCFYTTGFRGVVERCDETAYSLACQSADAGSWFGKMALAHFLKGRLGVQDPEEDLFDLRWTDPFIRNFASPHLDVQSEDVPAEDLPAEDVPAEDLPAEDLPAEEEDPFKDWSKSDLEDWFEPDRNILSNLALRRILAILIEEIQQERACNPNSPKVWLNLPAL